METKDEEMPRPEIGMESNVHKIWLATTVNRLMQRECVAMVAMVIGQLLGKYLWIASTGSDDLAPMPQPESGMCTTICWEEVDRSAR